MKKWIFPLVMLGYGLVALIAIAFGLTWLWNFLDGYEKTRPNIALEAYMEQLTAEYVVDNSEDLLAKIDTKLQTAEQCRQILLDNLTEKFTCTKTVESTENHYIFTVRCGAKIIGKVEMESNGQQYGDYQAWQVTKDSFDLSFLVGNKATITVDASCTDSFDKALHEKVLDVLAGFQVKVINR